MFISLVIWQAQCSPSQQCLSTAIWNGGGVGSSFPSGGGSTDVRTVATSTRYVWDDPASLKSRIIVAGAGGGSTGNLDSNGYYMYSTGGQGGGLTGYMGGWTSNHSGWNTSYSPGRGTGGAQTAPGYINNSTSNKGSFGIGGSATTGGGGGWYGGGAGNSYAAGGGGSSYISGHKGCVGVNSSGNPIASAYTTYTDSVSYTNYAFTETKIVDGTGYKWETSKITSAVENQPTYDGTSKMTGNSGDGHVKITYIGA